jgi:tetratricopeptide (TPR) repeat protein
VTNDLTLEQRRRLAVHLFNHAWALMRLPERTPEQDDEFIHAAHASRHHWAEVGTAANLARGEWQVSRVYATLGRSEPALFHAERCLAYCESDPDALDDWDLPYAYEALARAYAVGGNTDEAEQFAARARELSARVADEEDREQLTADLKTV